jgi:hypothetical protein
MSADRFYGGQGVKKGSAGITLNVLGHEQLTELFKQLTKSQEKSVQISAFRVAARPLLADAKNNLKSRTRAKGSGLMFKSLGVAPLRNLPVLKIGARTHGNFAGHAGHLLDEGTKKRSYIHKKSGKEHNTGQLKPTKFWTDAVSKNERGMVENVQSQIITAFDRLIVKYNNKMKT